jgi:hypothetical protein
MHELMDFSIKYTTGEEAILSNFDDKGKATTH